MRYIFLLTFLFMTTNTNATTLKIEEKTSFDIVIAQTPQELQTGLMYRKKIAPTFGMLFDLRQYPNTCMWMKNTYIPLDMLFINCENNIVHIHKNAKPLSLEAISSPTPYCYVLEIAGGSSEKYNITNGDKITITPSI